MQGDLFLLRSLAESVSSYFAGKMYGHRPPRPFPAWTPKNGKFCSRLLLPAPHVLAVTLWDLCILELIRNMIKAVLLMADDRRGCKSSGDTEGENRPCQEKNNEVERRAAVFGFDDVMKLRLSPAFINVPTSLTVTFVRLYSPASQTGDDIKRASIPKNYGFVS